MSILVGVSIGILYSFLLINIYRAIIWHVRYGVPPLTAFRTSFLTWFRRWPNRRDYDESERDFHES